MTLHKKLLLMSPPIFVSYMQVSYQESDRTKATASDLYCLDPRRPGGCFEYEINALKSTKTPKPTVDASNDGRFYSHLVIWVLLQTNKNTAERLCNIRASVSGGNEDVRALARWILGFQYASQLSINQWITSMRVVSAAITLTGKKAELFPRLWSSKLTKWYCEMLVFI